MLLKSAGAEDSEAELQSMIGKENQLIQEDLIKINSDKETLRKDKGAAARGATARESRFPAPLRGVRVGLCAAELIVEEEKQLEELQKLLA